VSAVWLWAVAVLRGRARMTLLLAVLVGLTGGVVLAAVAGTRRTDAALPRFVARDHTIDALVYPQEDFESRDPLAWQLQELAALPEVAGATRVRSVLLTGLDQPGSTDRRAVWAAVPMDPGGSRIYGHPHIGHGDAVVGEPELGVLDQVADDSGVVVRCHARVLLRGADGG
jgi:hypothetical protein